MIQLKHIIQIINQDTEMEKLDIKESLDLQSYYYLTETIDLANHYNFENAVRFSATFEDANNVQHFIKINFVPSEISKYEVKFGFIGKDGKPSYERPNIHYKSSPDEKIFNTHLHILLNVFLKHLDFFTKADTDRLFLPATDYARYRLYKMSINKVLDKTLYKLVAGTKNEFIIEKL